MFTKKRVCKKFKERKWFKAESKNISRWNEKHALEHSATYTLLTLGYGRRNSHKEVSSIKELQYSIKQASGNISSSSMQEFSFYIAF